MDIAERLGIDSIVDLWVKDTNESYSTNYMIRIPSNTILKLEQQRNELLNASIDVLKFWGDSGFFPNKLYQEIKSAVEEATGKPWHEIKELL